MNLEFVERLPAPDGEERWLVHVAGGEQPQVAWLFTQQEEPDWLVEVERRTRAWIGFAHPRVSRVFETAWVGERLVCVIDDDRGPSLADAAAVLAETPHERERWTVAQFITIADGLATMAQRQAGFIHRRIEPHRLFVNATGHGQLRAPVETVSVGPRRNYVGAGRVIGTPRWMSPEQGRGVALTAASDVFSLASNLAFALTGEPPFDDDNPMATLTKIILGPAPSLPTYAPGLDRVIARAFAIDPAARYPDPAAFAGELYACIPDAGDYNACMSDRIAAWWPAAPQAFGVNHDIAGERCTKSWDALAPGASDDLDIRHCTQCDQPVVRATSLAAVLPLVGRSCFAYRPRS
jgi:hypothetical protein